MRGPRVGALAGVGFVLVGVVELLLTGGPAPDPPTALGSVDFFRGTADAGPAIAVLSAVAGVLFLVFAGSTAAAALREQVLPGWLAVLGVLAAVAPLVAVAAPSLAGVGFPVFLLWLLGTSVALARLPGAARPSARRPRAYDRGTDTKEG